MKLSSTQEPTSSRARHTTLILQQCGNTALSTKRQAVKAMPNPLTPETHYWTPHCTPEERDPGPSIRTWTQTPLTRKPWQATSPTPPTGSKLHNKEEPEVKASVCNTGDLGLIPGLGRSPGEGNDNPLQYSCLENPMDGGAWWASVHGVTKSWTWLSDITHSLTYFQPTERLPQIQQSKQKKRQRNIQHIKEHDKCPPNQTNEEEIGSLPEK